MTRGASAWLAGLGALALALAGCGSDPAKAVIDPGDGGRYAPRIDPAGFVANVDNPYLPLVRGSRWVYEGRTDEGVERAEVVVTDDRRTVMGVEVMVVRDTVRLDGQLVEDTFDWFAQDDEGNVWYFGEESKDYEDGELVGTSGSWEAGVDGALPGIAMPARPHVGLAYRQEFAKGEAEDLGEVIRVDTRRAVAFGRFADVVVTRDWNPLEPDVVEEKSYAPGVGLVFETKTAGGRGTMELIEFSRGAGK